MQQSQRSLDAVRDYIEIIRRALADAATLLPEDGDGSGSSVDSRRPGLVVFCSEHGFCGAFNDPLIRAAADGAQRASGIFNSSSSAHAAPSEPLSAELRPALTLSMATHSGGVTAVARRSPPSCIAGFSRRR